MMDADKTLTIPKFVTATVFVAAVAISLLLAAAYYQVAKEDVAANGLSSVTVLYGALSIYAFLLLVVILIFIKKRRRPLLQITIENRFIKVLVRFFITTFFSHFLFIVLLSLYIIVSELLS